MDAQPMDVGDFLTPESSEDSESCNYLWAKRREILGFRPQCDNVFNRYLPYSDQLDKEAVEYLKQIKVGLGRGLLLSEHKSQWIYEIKTYISLYGHFFPKEDHILFINVLLEYLQADLEVSTTSSLVIVLLALIRKQRLLSSNDLTIEWRPLYNLYCKLVPYKKNCFQVGQSYGLDNNLMLLIESARDYFPLSATQEILDELRPLMCPFTACKMRRATLLLRLFLPTQLPPEHHDKGYKLWFDEIIKIWLEAPKSLEHESNIFMLLCRLASNTIGYIDWTPYLPKIFTGFMAAFRTMAIVGSIASLFSAEHGNTTIQYSSESNLTSVMMISLIGGHPKALDYIENFFKAIESYFHPSNMSRFGGRLCQALSRVTEVFVQRIKKEKDTRKNWLPQTPENCRITDDDIDRFIDIMMPVISTALFARLGNHRIAKALKDLAWLRPQKVIPPILEKMYSAFDMVLEAHRLNALMTAVSSLAAAMIDSGGRYEEGKTHLIPLIFSALPALDCNDIKKCVNAFALISNLLNTVPLIDCSRAVDLRTDLTETEYNICLETAKFEEFVIIFVEKVLSLVESFTSELRPDNEPARRGSEENLFESRMIYCFSTVLHHSSPQIFESALRKLFSYLNGRLFADESTSRLMAIICGLYAKANPTLAMKKFVPYFTDIILRATENDDVYQEESIDNHLAFALQILAETMFDGVSILQYQHELTQVLDRCLRLKPVEGHQPAAHLLRNCLESLTSLYPQLTDTSPMFFPNTWQEISDFENILPIRIWGQPCNMDKLEIVWHTPSAEELEFAKSLTSKFLFASLQRLEDWSTGKVSLMREEVQHEVFIVLNAVIGISFSIAPLEFREHRLLDTRVPLLEERIHEIGIEYLSIPGVPNLRNELALRIRKILLHIIAKNSDDTKSMNRIIKTYQCLLCWIKGKSFLKISLNQYRSMKGYYDKSISRSQRLPRRIIIDRVRHQHEVRLSKKTWGYFTEIHRDMILDLINLATSHYSDVRSKALTALTHFKHPHGYRLVGKEIERIMLDSNEAEAIEKREGVLNILLNYRSSSTIVSLSDWTCATPIWLAIVNCPYLEKTTIVSAMEKLTSFVSPKFQPLVIDYEVAENLQNLAHSLWEKGLSIDPKQHPNQEQVSDGLKQCKKANLENLNCYLTLVKKLVESIEIQNLHWRHLQFAFLLLRLLIRKDVKFPIEAVRTMVKNLLNERIYIRRLCFSGIALILKQHKPTVKKKRIEVDFTGKSGSSSYDWLYFYPEIDYYKQDVWDGLKFCHQTYLSFNFAPKEGIKYVTENEAISSRGVNDVDESENPILQFFQDEDKVLKLLHLISLDENSMPSFDTTPEKCSSFHAIFRNFGLNVLPPIATFFDKLVKESAVYKPENKESHKIQRVASRIMVGLVKGSKYWPYSDMVKLREMAEPLFKKLFAYIMTPETMQNWISFAFSAFRFQDGRRFSWLFKLLVEDPLNLEEPSSTSHDEKFDFTSSKSTSFQQSCKLNMLYVILGDQNWRAIPLHRKLLSNLMDKNYLQNPYLKIRGLLGALLAVITLYDTNYCETRCTLKDAPKVDHIFESLMPRLEYFKNVSSQSETIPSTLSTITLPSLSSFISPLPSQSEVLSESQENSDNDNDEEKEALKLLTTVCYWIQNDLGRNGIMINPIYFRALPIICEAVNRTKDNEIVQTLFNTISWLSGCLLNNHCVETALSTCSQMIHSSKSWHAKNAVVSFLRIMVSMNLFTLMSKKEHVDRVTQMVISLLQDERVEVREQSSVVLEGLIHYYCIKVDSDLIKMFRKKCEQKLDSFAKNGSSYSSEKLVQKHAGVLGLCSIVTAFPYEVPDFLPDILMILVNHLHDPQPIPGTIRKCLSHFKRTHHDNWRQHRTKFNEDQLGVITDLLVSPNYYA